MFHHVFRSDDKKSQQISPTINDTSHSILSTVITTTTTTTTTTKAINPIDGLLSILMKISYCIQIILLAGYSCPLCNEIFQINCHRPIGELTCGHLLCYQCFVLNTNQFGCIQCKDPSEVIY